MNFSLFVLHWPMVGDIVPLLGDIGPSLGDIGDGVLKAGLA